jgi:hypothetical protein
MPWTLFIRLRVIYFAYLFVSFLHLRESFAFLQQPKHSADSRLYSDPQNDARNALKMLKKQERDTEILGTFDRIQQLRQKGLNYKGEPLKASTAAKLDAIAESKLQKEMEEAEKLLGGSFD